jgi:ABC-type phosphate/phosphonate transport system substrate-binding protein
VLRGNYDAGVTREHLVKEFFNANIRAVQYSEPIPSPPLAVAADYNRELVKALKRALLAVGSDEQKRQELTKEWDPEFIHGFVEANDSDYNVIRAMNRTR